MEKQYFRSITRTFSPENCTRCSLYLFLPAQNQPQKRDAISTGLKTKNRFSPHFFLSFFFIKYTSCTSGFKILKIYSLQDYCVILSFLCNFQFSLFWKHSKNCIFAIVNLQNWGISLNFPTTVKIILVIKFSQTKILCKKNWKKRFPQFWEKPSKLRVLEELTLEFTPKKCLRILIPNRF